MAGINSNQSGGGGGPSQQAVVGNPVAGGEELSDDGLVVLSQVLGVHLTMFNIIGYANSWPETQPYFAETLGQSLSKISVVVYVQIFGLIMGMFFCPTLTNPRDFRYLYGMGTLLLIIGITTASSSATYWRLFFSQGVCVGIANALLCCYAAAMILTYFNNRKFLALGFALAGGPTGGTVISLVIRRMMERVGFAWAMGAVGFISAGTLLYANWTLRTEPLPGGDDESIV
ncbi:hypothetical protein HOY80DRAFT_1038554 [Tuber brumale]|nr:hypothetical protein HOY80DRAFT_1038554 [Tuber brumale]